MTGFDASSEDLSSVGKSFHGMVEPLNGAANEISGSSVSGDNVGEPFHHHGEQYRSLLNDIEKSVHDYALRVAGIANALGASSGTYSSIDTENAADIGSIRFGGQL